MEGPEEPLSWGTASQDACGQRTRVSPVQHLPPNCSLWRHSGQAALKHSCPGFSWDSITNFFPSNWYSVF